MFISSLRVQQRRFQMLQNFLGKIKTWPGERWRVASRLIKYATIISVPTVARSLFPSLRDAAKRSLFGLTDERRVRRESGEFSARKLARRGGAILLPYISLNMQ